MFDIDGLVLTDDAVSLIDNGAWVGGFADAPGLELLVCGLTSLEARKAIEAKQATARMKNKGNLLKDAQLATIMQEVLAEAVLRGWRGLSSEGEPLPYSKELATKFLTSRGGEKFTVLVLSAAQKLDKNANDFVEKVAKN